MTTIPTTVQERIPLPGPNRPNSASKGITGADLLAILRQRMLQVIVFWFVFGCIGVGLFFVWMFKFPSYSAEAFVRCISPSPKTMDVHQERLQQDSYERFVRTQAMRVTQPDILMEVLKDPTVRETVWFNTTEQDERETKLDKALSSAPVRDTELFRVSMSTGAATDPHKIVNAAVNIYIQEAKAAATWEYSQELEKYKEELADVQRHIQQRQEEIRTFKAQLPPGEAPGSLGQSGLGITGQQLLSYQTNVNQLEYELSRLMELKDLYSNPNVAATPEDTLLVEQDMRVAQLDSQVFSLEQEISVRLNSFGPNHREVKDMKLRLDEAKRQLDIARSDKLREITGNKREQVETALATTQSSLAQAQERLAETLAQQSDLDNKLAELQALEEDKVMLDEIRVRINEYIRDIERIVKERSGMQVTIAQRAQPPRRRSSPTLLLLPAIVVGTLALALGLAIGLDLLDTSVRTTRDIAQHLSIPILGSIPDVDDEEVEIERVEMAVQESPHSMVTEAFRTVRSNLQFSAPPDRMRTILVTSPRPEDGKTAIASNLAASLAMAGKRVLLVDTNFRRPALRGLYSKIGDRGVSNVLVGEIKLADCIHGTALTNLDVVGSGPTPPNPAELLSGELFSILLADASRSYDHVIFDSPPVLLANDAVVLATLVDGTIMVYRAKYNSRGVAQRAYSLLQHASAHVFGAVLNAAQARRGGYFREQLRTFYEYQVEEDSHSVRPPALPDDSDSSAPRVDDKGKRDDLDDEATRS